jgi:DNA replication protein DnaC
MPAGRPKSSSTGTPSTTSSGAERALDDACEAASQDPGEGVLAVSAPVDIVTDLYRKMLRTAGVPAKFSGATMDSCQRYASEPGKAAALRDALALAREGAIEADGRVLSGLLISGPHGTGKTWLATALLKNLMWQEARRLAPFRVRSGSDPKLSAFVWTEAFLFDEEVKDAYATGASALAVKRRHWDAAGLLLDDIGSLERGGETAHRSELLHQTLEYRKNRDLPTILTTNLDGKGLRQHFGERSLERMLEMCALVRMEGMNLRIERP